MEVLPNNNGYEQFTRNLAAEKICKLIDDLAYTRAHEDLRREEIAIPPTFAYPDNQATLDVFEAPKSGLMELVQRSNGTKELLAMARKALAKHPKITFPEKNASGRAPEVLNLTLTLTLTLALTLIAPRGVYDSAPVRGGRIFPDRLQRT